MSSGRSYGTTVGSSWRMAHTASNCAVAPADCRPAGDARQATDTPPGVHVGGSEAQPPQLCHSTHAGGCFARTPGRVLRCMAGPVVAVL